MKTTEELAERYVAHNRSYPYDPLNAEDRYQRNSFLAGYEACRNHIHLHWKEEWKELYKAIEESSLPAMDAMEGRYLRKVKELEAKIAELETQLENWQHNAIHGDNI
jgi:tRNA(Ile)-lysidine synthase TilS/MesJ